MTLFLSDHTCLLMAPQKVANHRFSFKAGPPAEGRCFAKQRKLFEAAGDRWIGRTQFIDIGLKNRMLKTSKQFFPFWPSARSYELGLLSFSAAEQNSPALLRVK